METIDIKKWLESYQGLKFEYDTWCERSARLDNKQYIPAMQESDGSMRNPGASDRMANAVARRMMIEEETAPKINRIKAEMRAIEDVIDALPDPMHRAVLNQRYIIGGEGYRLKPWAMVAMMMYHRDDESALTRVKRLHRAAIDSITEIRTRI